MFKRPPAPLIAPSMARTVASKGAQVSPSLPGGCGVPARKTIASPPAPAPTPVRASAPVAPVTSRPSREAFDAVLKNGAVWGAFFSIESRWKQENPGEEPTPELTGAWMNEAEGIVAAAKQRGAL